MPDFVIRYRWWIIIVSLLTGAVFGSLIPGTETDPEMRNYIPAGMSSRIKTDKIESEFGVQDMVVILFSDSSVLDAEVLQQIKDADRDIARLQGVSSRISPFTVRSIKGDEGMMVAEPLIKRIPSDTHDIRLLAEEISNNQFAMGIVISSDMTCASITATINDSESETETLHKIDSVIRLHKGRASVITGGLPYIRQHIMSDVRKDGLILIPLALLIILSILKMTMGRWRFVFMTFSVVVISVAASMGMISLFGWKLSILTLLLPVLLIAVANNYGIYLIVRFQELSADSNGIPKREMISELFRSLKMPILFSGLTTVAGILGLVTHSIMPARQVGILAAIGIIIALSLSLLLIPAYISAGGPVVSQPVRDKNDKSDAGLLHYLLSSVSRIIVTHPVKILVASALVTLIMSLGIILIRIDTNQENYFPRKHPVRKASEVINSKFGGSQTISVMISGDIKSPEVMKGIDELTNKTEALKGVGKVFSISQVVREMTKAIYDKDETGYDAIPTSGEAIAQLFELYNMSGDQADYKQIMNFENTRAHVLIRLSDPTHRVIKSVTNTINALTENFPAQVTVGGYAIIMADFAGSIVRGQIRSLLFALVAVIILLSLVFKSFKGGLTGSIPLFASIFILFGFMGFAGIALDAATALLSSIMIGVGVDFTIQYIWCFSSFLRSGQSYEDSTIKAIGSIGRSIIINAVSVMGGFSVLMLSGFTSIRFFSYLVLISIGFCLIGALIVIPAFILHFRPGFVR
jgi:hydrophobe/amphiphile efflux-3 (HAE3) family protein